MNVQAAVIGSGKLGRPVAHVSLSSLWFAFAFSVTLPLCSGITLQSQQNYFPTHNPKIDATEEETEAISLVRICFLASVPSDCLAVMEEYEAIITVQYW